MQRESQTAKKSSEFMARKVFICFWAPEARIYHFSREQETESIHVWCVERVHAMAGGSWGSKDYICTTRFQVHLSPSLGDVLAVCILCNVSLTDEVQNVEKMLSNL